MNSWSRVHIHPVLDCSNLHKWWLSQVKWPECLSHCLSNWGLMGDLLFNNVSLCPRHFVLYHLFSGCSLSQTFPFLSLFTFFLLYCPPFQHPVLSSLSYGRHDSLYQIELVRKIFLVWSQKPTVLLKDIVIGGVSRCMPSLEGGAILGQCCHTSFLYRLPPPTTFHWTPLSIQHNLTSLRHL